jgi:hypothetical protein
MMHARHDSGQMSKASLHYAHQSQEWHVYDLCLEILTLEWKIMIRSK